MYAIAEIGGKQFIVKEGDTLDVEKVSAEPGAAVTFDKVLLVSKDEQLEVGTPFLKGAKILAKISDHAKGPKVISFKFKNKTNYHRTIGHRQPFTRVIVEKIEAGK